MKSFFTPKEVAMLVNISYRQIQYWDKTHFIRPSYRRRGKYRLYTFSDLIQLKLASTLRDHDFSIQQLRKTMVNLKELLPRVTHPLVDLTFLIEGDRILAFNGEVIINDPAGQNYIRFDVKSLRDEINAHYPETLPVRGGYLSNPTTERKHHQSSYSLDRDKVYQQGRTSTLDQL